MNFGSVIYEYQKVNARMPVREVIGRTGGSARVADHTGDGRIQGRLCGPISCRLPIADRAPNTVIALFTTCAVSSCESEELDERPHALFLTAVRKSLGSC